MRKDNTERNHNWYEARKYFIETGQWFKGAVMHHIDPTLRYRDYERYLEWRIEDLMVMSFSDHSKLHTQGEDNPMYGKHHTEETKAKLSESLTGREFTLEHRENLSKASKGRPKSEEHKRKLSEANKGKGSPRTEETRKKMSEAKKAYWAKKREAVNA